MGTARSAKESATRETGPDTEMAVSVGAFGTPMAKLAAAAHSDPLLDQAQSTTRLDHRELHRVTQETDDYAVL